MPLCIVAAGVGAVDPAAATTGAVSRPSAAPKSTPANTSEKTVRLCFIVIRLRIEMGKRTDASSISRACEAGMKSGGRTRRSLAFLFQVRCRVVDQVRSLDRGERDRRRPGVRIADG